MQVQERPHIMIRAHIVKPGSESQNPPALLLLELWPCGFPSTQTPRTFQNDHRIQELPLVMKKHATTLK
jgi:hypothetical protein